VARLERLLALLQGGTDTAAEASTLADLEVCMEYINER
jgi:hypothetical protein